MLHREGNKLINSDSKDFKTLLETKLSQFPQKYKAYQLFIIIINNNTIIINFEGPLALKDILILVSFLNLASGF